MAVITEAKLRELVGKGQKEIIIDKGTIITPAARDFAIQAGVKVVLSDMLGERGSTCIEETEGSSGLTTREMGSIPHEVMPAQEDRDLLDKVSEMVKQRIGDNAQVEEVVAKVLASLKERYKFFTRSSLLARTRDGQGISVTLPSGSRCSIGVMEIKKGIKWEAPRDILLLVSSGKLKVLPEGTELASGYVFYINPGSSLEALEDTTIFCII